MKTIAVKERKSSPAITKKWSYAHRANGVERQANQVALRKILKPEEAIKAKTVVKTGVKKEGPAKPKKTSSKKTTRIKAAAKKTVSKKKAGDN